MRIRLVFVPGRQARLDLLCPKTTPLILTGMLRNEGLFADYMDFGSLAAFSSHKKDGHLEGDNGKTSCHFWNRSDHSFSFRQTADTTQDAAIGTAILHAAPSLIVWYVKNRDDYHTVKSISRYIRQQAPETHQTLIGPYITCYGASALNNFSSIDTGITGDQLSALIALSENIHTPESWGRIPGLIFHNRSGITCSTKNIYPVRNLLPPDFAAFSCQNDCPTKQGQFSLYPLSFVCNYSPEYGLKPGAIRPLQKSVPHLFDEMQTLNTCYGAGAFHIEAPHVAAPALERFADTLLENNFMTLYSLGGLTEAFSAPLADRLFASGCRAVGFHTPSGSQRLLEDFYGCNMSISALRATLRHCRAAGLFTVAHLRYPCPHDDYHSRAETELFLEACRPDGVTIEAPELMPESIWFTRAPEYGFLLDHRSFQHWIECSPKQRGAPPYRMQGWKKGHAEEARGTLEAMAESLGCIPDITEQQGLLARIARSAMEESTFLEQLQQGLRSNDPIQLQELMQCVNSTLDVLCADTVLNEKTVSAL